MGATLPPRGGSGGRHRRSPISDINVTPMVDVMLVLLVIFMVTAPLLVTGVDVELPKASSPSMDQDNTALTVSVQRDGGVFINQTAVSLDTLAAKMDAITGTNPDARVYVRGDEGVPYGRVMAAMGALYEGGYRRVALITQPGGGSRGADAAEAPR
ncbi:ExbD/TolR family protein [Roseospira visakhapatnamensis]|uniref:Biopolymer transport protein TolR n=1 Tax=Roseospira visakhapatnamensis TaxID=390880 RepID=A0A7W6RAW6_9PROT|nr:biopolymer transporter ExbD [Roseospira visakhapatnamensis]MBB4264987.1 biopolymer transport protein TolR [Roseospira visakhapatnamensis]